MKPKHKKIIKTICKYSFIIFIILYFDVYGLAAVGLYYIGFALYGLFMHWDQYLTTKEMVETYIFGKPLKYFNKGELKNHKVKVVWKRDKDGERKRD